MLLKALGVIFISLGGSMAGALKALTLSGRVNILKGLYEALLIFENEIDFKTSPIKSAFEAAAPRDKSGIFQKASESVFEMGAAESMREAVKSAKLLEEEEEMMLSFSEGLSAENSEGQTKNVRLALKRADKILKKAENEQEKLFSLYCTMGVLFGIAFSIMLI